jgi:hypothetical protein
MTAEKMKAVTKSFTQLKIRYSEVYSHRTSPTRPAVAASYQTSNPGRAEFRTIATMTVVHQVNWLY